MNFFGAVIEENIKCEWFSKMTHDETLLKVMETMKAEICHKVCWKGHNELLKSLFGTLSLNIQDISGGKGKFTIYTNVNVLQ
jgi:hypothetical protein